jgi:hypothetical protein
LFVEMDESTPRSSKERFNNFMYHNLICLVKGIKKYHGGFVQKIVGRKWTHLISTDCWERC